MLLKCFSDLFHVCNVSHSKKGLHRIRNLGEWQKFKKYILEQNFKKHLFFFHPVGFYLGKSKKWSALQRCLLWRSLKSRRGSLGKAKGRLWAQPCHADLDHWWQTARSSDVVGSQRAWGQVCALAFLEVLSQQCEAAVDLCKEMACLAQGEKTATFLVLLLIFEWSLSSQRWGQSARQEARLWGTSSSHVAHTPGSSKLRTFAASRDANRSSVPLCCYSMELDRIANLILGLPGNFGFCSSCWSMAGGLDYPGPFIPAQLCCWSQGTALAWIMLDLHAAQGGHAARKSPKPWPRRNSFEMVVVSLNLTPQQCF